MSRQEPDRPVITIQIRELRREKALTQEELAEALGLSRQSINAMEAGRCLPSLPVAMQIADFFSVPLQRLFNFMDEAARSDVVVPSSSNQIPNPKEVSMATLVPWSPLREMRSMLDELMDETSWSPVPQLSVPAVNVKQSEKQVEVEMRLPGFKKEDIEIEVGEDFVTVKGEHKAESEEGEYEGNFFRREFVQQSFARTVALPALVQTDGAEAEMKHGILHLKLNKIIEEKPKTTKVHIKSAE